MTATERYALKVIFDALDGGRVHDKEGAQRRREKLDSITEPGAREDEWYEIGHAEGFALGKLAACNLLKGLLDAAVSDAKGGCDNG